MNVPYYCETCEDFFLAPIYDGTMCTRRVFCPKCGSHFVRLADTEELIY
jgi:Zn finger protein HypA/HybF involved in hydrogenase expression